MSDSKAVSTDFSGQYIAGQWRPGKSGKTLPNINPYTGETIFDIQLASEQDLDEAYKAAQAAQVEWAKRPPQDRAEVFIRAATILEERRAEIIEWIIRESGGTRIKAEDEWRSVHRDLRAGSGFPFRGEGRIVQGYIPGEESRIYRSPIGVVGVISPWNFPMHLTCRSAIPALALGNGVVVKPAEDTPVTGGMLIAQVLEQAGLPKGLLNVIVGLPDDVGDAFTLHPIPRFISFTGSTRVGRRIGEMAIKASLIKRVGLEMGGNNPCVVLDDADLELAVNCAVVGRFLHLGQICMSSNRIIVDAKIYDRFVEAFVAKVKTLKVGNPSDPDTVIGPLINDRQLKAALKRLEAAKAEGMELVLGGEPEGLVLPPHVFINVNNDSPMAQAEQFAPIALIIKAKDEADALRIANGVEYGLSSAVFSKDEGRALRFAKQVDAGMTHINDISINDEPWTMFGGNKNSGLGRFNSDWIIDAYTDEQWISVQHEAREYPF